MVLSYSTLIINCNRVRAEYFMGRSSGAMVLGKFPVPGRPTNWIRVRQGHTALAVGAGGDCFGLKHSLFVYSYITQLQSYSTQTGFRGPSG